MKKTIIDIFYNVVYQILVVFLPFATIPYLSRVLGPELIGINGFIMSIIQFLSIVTLSGLSQFGVREVRKASIGNKGKEYLSEKFFSLYIYQFFLGLISIIIYISIGIFQRQSILYYFALLPFLISGIFDISWFFQGIEEIKKVVLRNTIIKLSTLVMIFIFVKSEKDFLSYLLIMSFGTLVGNLILWLPIIKKISFKFPKIDSIIANKNTLLLLLPQIAIQIYISFDTILLGFFSDNFQVAYYSQSQKIVRIISTIISSISLVLMPRMVAIISQKPSNINNILKKSYEFTLFFSSLFSAILFCNVEMFVPWFFGEGYEPMILIIKFLSILIVLIPVGGVFSNQFAIAIGEDKLYIKPLILGALLSLFLNILLIPNFQAFGAAITSLIVEFVVCIYRVYIVKDHYENTILKKSIYFICVFIVTCVLGSIFKIHIFDSVFLNLCINSVVISLLYLLGIYSFRNEISCLITTTIRKLSVKK